MDPVPITIPIHRPLHYMTLEPFFRVPFLGALIRWCRAFPVREDEADRQAVRTAIRLLRAGEALGIFPEGGRTPDGRLQPFRPGAFRLALQMEAPIVPVTIQGAFEAWPVGRRLPRLGRHLPPAAHPRTCRPTRTERSSPSCWPSWSAAASRGSPGALRTATASRPRGGSAEPPYRMGPGLSISP
jgi:1-acyl-sn-glycerol-3-phosphate acyltransferase